MRYIQNDSTNPYFNLALEEYVLKYLEPRDNYFILWQNAPSIIVGRFQNTLEEINSSFVKENKIHVVRRVSGGGAVYHDLGNLNFTFVLEDVKAETLDYGILTEPIVKALGRLGVKAELTGRNDLTIDGRKFSGNAQHMYKNRLLHHGTILFNSDLEILQKALNADPDKFRSKGVKSVRSRVTNVSEHLKEKIDIQQFKELIKKYTFEYLGERYQEYRLKEDDYSSIKRLAEGKYAAWEWNYGESPQFNYRNSKRFKGGKVEVYLDVKDGIIASCSIYGDFLGLHELSAFEKGLEGKRYREEEILSYLKAQDIPGLFGGITADELVSCFFTS